MSHKNFKYYINTIFLKSNAQMYDWADRLQLWETSKKQIQAAFEKMYSKHFSRNKTDINSSFSKEYVPYRFFSKATDFEQNLMLNTEGVATHFLDAPNVSENPLIPAYFGLVCYNDFLLNKNEDSLTKFWSQTKHLETIGIQKNETLLYFYKEDFALFDVKSPWYSGITQGLVTSVFARAFDLSKNAVYKEKARQAIEAMFIPVENGGVFCKTPEGFDWVEEYPSVSRRSLVLLGFIFSIAAIYEYLILCGEDKSLEKRLEKLIESLFKSLHHYIRGRFVKYSRFSKAFQNLNYQGLIVFQFLHLYELSDNKAFFDLALMFHKNTDLEAFYRFHNLTRPSNLDYFNA